MPIVFAGAAISDAIALVDAFPGADGRVMAREVVQAGGGPAATAAVAAARLGCPDVCFIGAVGDDEDGRRIVPQLASEGVDVSGVRVEAQPSGASVGIVDRVQGTRALCTQPGPALELEETQRQLVRSADWLHVDHLGWGPVIADLSAQPADARPRLSVDAGNPIPGFDPRGVDLYVPTVDRLVEEYGRHCLDELLAAALTAGAHTVVATRGSAGSIAASTAGERITAAALPLDPHSTLGAGDVFHGALLVAAADRKPLADCLAYANAVAGLSCRGLDGRSAIPSHHEALEALKNQRIG